MPEVTDRLLRTRCRAAFVQSDRRNTPIERTLCMKTLLALLALLLSPSLTAAHQLSHSHSLQVIERLRAQIDQNYVMLDALPAIDSALATITKEMPPPDQPSSASELADTLSTALRRFDSHFAVKWRAPASGPEAPVGESWFDKLDRQNSGFRRVEILDGNIGYVDFWGFDQVTPQSTARVAKAMAFIADTDAVIFDLRNNGGGSGDMVRLISSYFLPADIHLNSFYWRPSDSTTEFRTLAEVDGIRRTEVPIYVLIGPDTFSAAEEFAYNLKHLRRATVIGKASKGGANPWQFFDLGHGFRAAIPIGKAINPITASNWEQVGVQPDVVAAPKEAKPTAYRAALLAVQATASGPNQLQDIARALSQLDEPRRADRR